MPRPKGSKNKNTKSESIDKNTVLITKKGYDNEFLDFLNGNNLDNGSDPIDDFINGKKLVWKKKYVVYKTNTKHGKVATETEAVSDDYTEDRFFSSAYREGEFILQNKKTKEVLFRINADWQGNGFVKLCDFVNKLN